MEDNKQRVMEFLGGRDPLEHIVSIECGYDEKEVSIIYINADGQKRIRKDDFKPFVWAKNSVAQRMFGGDRAKIKKMLNEYDIGVKALTTSQDGKKTDDRLENGYKLLFYARRKMNYQTFLSFFTKAGTPIYEKRDKKQGENTKQGSSREFLAVSPVEQYMMSTGKRMFKGYEGYDELKRLQFDLETQGLNPKIHGIDQIGIRTNRGFERILSIEGVGEERKKNELNAIIEFIRILAIEKPDIVIGHNSENFDWNFIIVRCEVLGTSLEEISTKFFKHPIYKKKKETVLKLGGEVEYYKPTIMWGHNIIDSLHAVRRAQAIDSNMKKASLKYVTKYLDLKKPNRVYVQGDKIGTIWLDQEPNYAFNNSNGDWYKISKTHGVDDGYSAVSGRYIVERYLLDDIWETDKIELALNEANFLICKMLPTTFTRAATMGTAGIWKLIMLAWCYENNLAIPSFGESHRFTGGLSRLLKTGYVANIVKLDYNSLYPSIMLTWNIQNDLDITNTILTFLEYVLTTREYWKEQKAINGGKAKKLAKQEGSDIDAKIQEEIHSLKGLAAAADKKQLPMKILANSVFGAYGGPAVFPFGNIKSAEKVTCIGRMCLRLMISHFTNLGYTPIVGDTDGFNFKMPEADKFRYTEEHPYISNGYGRNSVKGKAYVGVEADVCEFEDMYFNKPWNGGVNKMGLGIDEFCDSTINFSRKNYCDKMPGGKIKMVGNTVKSRRMSGYIEKFLDGAIELLLNGKGQEFIESYYAYIEKIYNYQIPLRDIASKGKIKKTLGEYIADCKTLTKSGSKKSRQAWYELVLKEGMQVDLDDTIYYVNTGTKKSESDVKRITHQFVKDDEGNVVELDNKLRREILTREISKTCDESEVKDKVKALKTKESKEIIAPFIVKEEDEIILNCKIVPNEIVEAEEDILCTEDIEYNVVKYIEQFNSRIKPLLVCFSNDIRGDIMVKAPSERKYFTSEQCELVSGFPNKETDQDTYEQLMRPERKEIEYWLSIGEEPPFWKECGIDWSSLVEEHLKLKEEEKSIIFQEENEKYLKAIASLTREEVEEFLEDGTIPQRILDIVTVNTDMHFRFKALPEMSPSTGGHVFDDMNVDFENESEKEFESFVLSEG